MRRTLGALAAALVAACLAPSVAAADTHTFLSTDDLYPIGGAGDYGPAETYPSTINVSGVAGTVTNVTVAILGYRSAQAQDTDIVLVGPNGQKVLLMADACGTNPLQNDNWTFDDSAQTFLSAAGPCPNYQSASFKPSGYLGDDQADMTQFGAAGPPPPYVNALSFLAGSSPNGGWKLYVLDDTMGYKSFDIAGWALTMEVQPPATTPTTGGSGKTGKRAAAIKKCKRKKHRKARKSCIKQAKTLPV